MIINSKTCSKCKIEKPLEDFRPNEKQRFGRCNYCILCQDTVSKEAYERNKKKRIKQVNEWNNKNPDKTNEYSKNWREKNRGTGG